MSETMTIEMHGEFVREGCVPHCHTCRHPIPPGRKYALLSPPVTAPVFRSGWETTVEIMVCEDCEEQPLPEKEVARAVAFLTREKLPPPPIRTTSGCMIVNGRVVPGMAK